MSVIGLSFNLSNFLLSVFLTYLVSTGPADWKLLRKCICWILSFWDHHIEEMSTTAFIIEIPRNGKSFFSKSSMLNSTRTKLCNLKNVAFGSCVRILIDRWCEKSANNNWNPWLPCSLFLSKKFLDLFHEGANRKLRICSQPFFSKNCWFWSLHQILDSLKFPWKVINFDASHFPNSCLSVTTGLITSMKISRRLYLGGGDINRKIISNDPCIRILGVRVFQKVPLLLI